MRPPVDISNFFVQQRNGRTRLVSWLLGNIWPTRVHPTARIRRAVAGLTLPRAPSAEAIDAVDRFVDSWHHEHRGPEDFDLKQSRELLVSVLRVVPPDITPPALVERTRNTFLMKRDIDKFIAIIEKNKTVPSGSGGDSSDT